MTNQADLDFEKRFQESYDLDEQTELAVFSDKFHDLMERYGTYRVLQALNPLDDDQLYWYYNQY